MTVCVAFIRGINVGGNNPLPMATLRDLCQKVGMNDARTHIQSGNVVFRCGARSPASLAGKLEDAIEARCGFRPGVVVRTVEAVRTALDHCPFDDRASLEGNRLLVMFLSGKPAAGAAKALAAVPRRKERAQIVGAEVFLHFPDGIAESRMSMAQVERAIGVPGTCRNWNTIGKTLAIAEAMEE